MRDRDEELAALFSHPANRKASGDGTDARGAALSQILAETGRDYVTGLLRRHRGPIERASSGLVAQLERILVDAPEWDLGLAFPWQAILACFSGAEPDAALVAARVAGHLYGVGRASAWSARFARPRSLRLGRFITPEVSSLTVEGDVIEYRTPDRSVRASIEGGLRSLGVVEIDAGRCLWLTDGADREVLSLSDEFPFADQPLDDRVREMRDAVELVRAHAPDYLHWFGDSVRVVAALEGGGETLRSSSPPGHYGTIYVSSPLALLRVAESLVHEAAHQHFQAAELVMRFTRPAADERLYWSGYARKDRTIDRILFAFHAFANVALFYETVLATVDDPAVRERATLALCLHRPNLLTFKGYLDESKELSAAGRALYRTVDAKLGAHA